MNNLVSAIVPVYNGEKFIQRCIGSLMSQTYPNMEILIVDDGSTDNTPAICKELINKDARIRLIRQENSGVSVARNAGIQAATGDFITFVDADDWVAIDLVEKLMHAMQSNENADIAVCGYFEVTPQNIVSKPPFAKPAKSIKAILSQNTPAFSWGKLYRATLKPHMVYPEGVYMGEDTAMIIPLFSYAKDFVAIEEPLYYYFQNQGSVTHGITNTKKMFSYVKGCHVALKNCNPVYLEEVAMSIADRIISNENWFLKTCMADTVEYIRENMMPYFENNSYIKHSNRLSKLLTYPNTELISKNLYYDNFHAHALTDVEKACLQSWAANAPNMTIVELNESNCDIENAPQIIREKYAQKDYREVGNYFKMKMLYENGGVAVDKSCYFNSGLGNLRMERATFALKNRYDLQDHFFAARKGHDAIKFLLSTYLDDSIYLDQSITFLDRLKEMLLERYGYSPAGWTVKLNDGEVTVYKCDVLSYNITKNNVAQILDEDQLRYLNSEYVLLERTIFDYWEEDKNFLWSDRERLKKILNDGKKQPITLSHSTDDYIRSLEMELQAMKNSRSWRITAPLRKIKRWLTRKR